MTNLASVKWLRLRASTTADAARDGFSDMPGKLWVLNVFANEQGTRARWGLALRSIASTSCGIRKLDEKWAMAVTPMVCKWTGGGGCADKEASRPATAAATAGGGRSTMLDALPYCKNTAFGALEA